MNKKGIVPNIIIGIGIFTAALIISASFLGQKMAIAERTLGQDQAAIHLLGIEGQGALIYLDNAARLAADKAKAMFEASGGLEEDFEGGGYPCGQMLGQPYWYDDGDTCIPSFLDTLQRQYIAAMVTYLNAHPHYNYPSFTYHLEIQQKNVTVRGQSIQNMLLGASFDGNEVDYYQRTSFSSDYPAARTPVKLNYLDRHGTAIQYIVVHYTVTVDAPAAIRVLQQRGLSYHYIIDHDGTVFQTVPEAGSAQHGGCSVQEKGAACVMPNMNRPSIGISFANCGHGKGCQQLRTGSLCAQPENPSITVPCKDAQGTYYEVYDDAQIDAFIDLVADIIRRNPSLTPEDILVRSSEDMFVMHSDIITEKYDPGPLFEQQLPSIISRINDKLNAIDTPTGAGPTAPDLPLNPLSTKEELALIAEEAQITPQELENDKTLIGPIELCTGREAPTSGTYATRMNNEAFNTNGLSYLQSAVVAGLKEGVDPALLLAHAIKESSMGTNMKSCVTSAQKSSLTGCGWTGGPNGCAIDCSCEGENVESDEGQFACTARTDKAAYEEAMRGSGNAAGQYEKCNEYTDDPEKMWNCIFCIYQGNFEKSTATAEGMTFMEDGTCSYAEFMKEHYCPLHAYVESSGIIKNYEVAGGFGTGKKPRPSATYTIPLSFEETIDLDLSAYVSIKEFAEEVINECPDNHPQGCLYEKLATYNANNQGNQLTTTCDDNYVLRDVLKQYKSCLARPAGLPCSVHLYGQVLNNAFFLRFTDLAMEEIVTKKMRNIEKTSSRTVYEDYTINYINHQGRIEKEKITLGFSGTNRPEVDVYIRDNMDEVKTGIPFHERPLIFTKDNQNNTYLDLQSTEEQAMPAANTSFLLCQQEASGDDTGLSFAFNLEDPLPPPVTDLQVNYHQELEMYELSWTPVTAYENGEPVRDIMRYEVYCSSMGTLQPKKLMLSFDKTKTITRTDGEAFPPETYGAQGSMSLLLDQCGMGGSIGQGQVQIAVIAVDASGQYSIEYDLQTVSPSIIDIPSIPAINSLSSMGQQANERVEPPLGLLSIGTSLPIDQLQQLLPALQRYFYPEQTQDDIAAQFTIAS